MYLGLYERAQRVAKHLDQFIEEVIQEHVRNRRDGDVDVDSEEQSDFVDVFLSIEKSNTTGSLINRNAIKGLMLVSKNIIFFEFVTLLHLVSLTSHFFTFCILFWICEVLQM